MTGRTALRRTAGRVGVRVGALVGVCVLASGCSLFGGDDEASVFDIEAGQCFLTPEEVKAQVSDLEQVDCEKTHDQEAYAVVDYEPPTGAEKDVYPGDDALTSFAQGRCAEEFRPYVGIDYLDSRFYFTYLLPSARSWQDSDRSIVCFIIGTGQPLEGSAKGAKA